MTITVAAVYEGDGVLKLERPVDLKEKATVHVIIEADAEATTAREDDDPTGWKTARVHRDVEGCARSVERLAVRGS
jgi:predicted DNA-binding antitoxin AbrB/MazE fold protein